MGRRHQSKLPKLNRDSNSRKSLFRVQLKSLIEYGKLTTTVTKAKIIKRLFDKLAAKATEGTLASRRNVAATLGSPKLANRLVDSIIPVMGGRKSGFTTIQKVSVQKGDATSIATLSLMAMPPVVEKKVVEKKVKAAPVEKTKKAK
ncbi:TPA: 50S ribosomal protein L17 [Candidatus Collierbacteria bacterium]|uniref:50S ribosomal protein L17 n=1 Tax=Candidatus Collierbacteria bacterium GW2011_GWA2_42_17 TaxID=1618378 RepID=A0A0G1C0Z9_9BACT|nr:MAG: 50S ribosomal protein L17 [Candidatus Collierbacteria bacterium GW2011_GWB2_42_12]KKS43328.1 MAG: 50S ribosomal protein L17 [Candidatus Collierbacteria bacterium GW2011_GWA2_42_17]KKS61791.1 MAG: 50S ribosomal protein L17 [Candidatus Collierbacteria bacterium GW2011_GWF1_42_50]KKS64942.1 MAG: 50S ribosomal protein L17 [Candidatus Collierbacteria bacterium GW2011_GWF2_42_51]KKS66553.1 MAG: 50S ribosomal protein L17 [Candidatus Collierbacteria bacterium GW2011_GWA1_42_60]HAI22581.1 50S r